MKAVVLYHEPGEDATVEDRDVIAQRDAVAGALKQLGHETSWLGCTLDLAAAKQQLAVLAPDVVFNLVESLGGTDRLMVLATILLDALDVAYTGTQTDAILVTSNKLTAKQRLHEAGLPTASWLQDVGRTKPCAVPAANITDDPMPELRGAWPRLQLQTNDHRWILKPVSEHASFGMDDDAVVVAGDIASLAEKLRERERRIGRPLFAEQFIEGREFNLSLLDGQALPPAEIDFSSFPPDKPRIVGHQAKWDQGSFEYQQTPRGFDFDAIDGPLLERLAELARSCWQLFALTGYARVDFRVDREGQPWILEVNANPCLSPDAGFAAAVTRAGMTYDDAIGRIVDSSVRWASKPVESSPQPILNDTTALGGHRTREKPVESPRN